MIESVNLEDEKRNMKIEDAKIEGENIKIDVVKRIVPPHSKVSREVTNEDIDRVISESKVLYELCFEPTGLYKAAYAMHHAQIDENDPLSLFVTCDRKIVINPVITRHTNYLVDSKEGCVTFFNEPQVIHQRWHKIEVSYVTIMLDPENKDKFKLSSTLEEKLSGLDAFIWQHEIDHGLGKYIYIKE